MKMNIQNLVMAVVVLLCSISSHADSVRDGGMSGGGGGSEQAEPATEADVLSALFWSRFNLYLYFNKLSRVTLGESRMDLVKDKMLKVIESTRIYAATTPCSDIYGEPKDGSIFAPYPNAICISVKNMVMKLRKDNLNPQIHALVAHEFAHLAGFGEMDAVYLQDWVLKSFAAGPGDGVRMLEDAEHALWRIRFAVEQAAKNSNWNSLCYATDEIDHGFFALNAVEESGVYSLFDLSSDKRRNSYVLKNIISREAVCGFSDYHPDRERYRRNYQDDFGSNTQLTDTDLEKILWQGDGSQTAGGVLVKRIVNPGDGFSELRDISDFASASLKRIEMIKNLHQSPLVNTIGPF